MAEMMRPEDLEAGVIFELQALGTLSLSQSTDSHSLSLLQKPLRDLYFPYQKPTGGLQLLPSCRLVVSNRGLAVTDAPSDQQGRMGAAETLYSMPSIAFWMAVQFVIVKDKKNKERDGKCAFEAIEDHLQSAVQRHNDVVYVKLDHKHRHLTKVTSHPAIFACVLRRMTGVKAQELYAFVCHSEQQARDLNFCLNSASRNFTNKESQSSGIYGCLPQVPRPSPDGIYGDYRHYPEAAMSNPAPLQYPASEYGNLAKVGGRQPADRNLGVPAESPYVTGNWVNKQQNATQQFTNYGETDSWKYEQSSQAMDQNIYGQGAPRGNYLAPVPVGNYEPPRGGYDAPRLSYDQPRSNNYHEHSSSGIYGSSANPGNVYGDGGAGGRSAMDPVYGQARSMSESSERYDDPRKVQSSFPYDVSASEKKGNIGLSSSSSFAIPRSKLKDEYNSAGIYDMGRQRPEPPLSADYDPYQLQSKGVNPRGAFPGGSSMENQERTAKEQPQPPRKDLKGPASRAITSETSMTRSRDTPTPPPGERRAAGKASKTILPPPPPQGRPASMAVQQPPEVEMQSSSHEFIHMGPGSSGDKPVALVPPRKIHGVKVFPTLAMRSLRQQQQLVDETEPSSIQTTTGDYDSDMRSRSPYGGKAPPPGNPNKRMDPDNRTPETRKKDEELESIFKNVNMRNASTGNDFEHSLGYLP